MGKLKLPATFFVPEGTLVSIRRVGSVEWEPLTTTHHIHFTDHEPTANGAFWVIRCCGWELRVAPSLLRGTDSRARPPKPNLPPREPGSPQPRRQPRGPDPLTAAMARARRDDAPRTPDGPAAAPGCGTDEWREQR